VTPPILTIIIKIHRPFHACQHETPDGIAGEGKSFGKDLFFFIGPAAKHIAYLTAGDKLTSDAKPKAGIILSTKDLCDMGQTVVTTITAFRAETNGSGGKGDIINNDEQVFQRDVFLFKPIVHA